MPRPAELDSMLRECDDTREMVREMAVTFRKLERDDEPIPFSFHWKLAHVPAYGMIFTIRFNGPEGPIASRLLPHNAFPVRAHIAPEKAVLEWKWFRSRAEF